MNVLSKINFASHCCSAFFHSSGLRRAQLDREGNLSSDTCLNPTKISLLFRLEISLLKSALLETKTQNHLAYGDKLDNISKDLHR